MEERGICLLYYLHKLKRWNASTSTCRYFTRCSCSRPESEREKKGQTKAVVQNQQAPGAADGSTRTKERRLQKKKGWKFLTVKSSRSEKSLIVKRPWDHKRRVVALEMRVELEAQLKVCHLRKDLPWRPHQGDIGQEYHKKEVGRVFGCQMNNCLVESRTAAATRDTSRVKELCVQSWSRNLSSVLIRYVSQCTIWDSLNVIIFLP